MAYMIAPQQRPNWDSFCYYKNTFTPEECAKIVELGLALPVEQGKVNPEELVDEATRKTRISWISWSDETNWIYQKLTQVATDANNARYLFNISGFFEALQFTRYDDPGSHYKWHQDIGPGWFAQRKLSLVVQLSPAEDYEGADLELFDCSPTPRDQGTVIVFPSYQQHRVTPITKGSRYSLVSWISGPPYA